MTATGHSDLPAGQGKAHADNVISSGQKTATGHAESSPSETGIDPRIETGLSENESFHAGTEHEKRATGTMTVIVALHLLTVNGKRRESENDGDVHGSYSTVIELSYLSVLLDTKIGNHGRITRGGETPKSLSILQVVERAVRNGERQPRQRRGKGKSVAKEQLPLRQLPKEIA